MKLSLAYIILMFLFITNCTNDKISTGGEDISNVDDSLNVDQADSVKKQFLPLLKGVWIPTDYIDAIEKTKSPLKSSNKLGMVSAMVIDGILQQDSLQVGVSWGNHEGGDFTVYFIPGQNMNSLKTDLIDYEEKSHFYEIEYEVKGDDIFLLLVNYDETGEPVKKQRFSKIADGQPGYNVSWGIQYVVNQKLIVGDYLMTDNTDSVSNVTFKIDEVITGHPKYKSFQIITDFVGAPEIAFDKICFNLHKENTECFASILKQDTLYLYDVTGDQETGEKLGKIRYKLVRKF